MAESYQLISEKLAFSVQQASIGELYKEIYGDLPKGQSSKDRFWQTPVGSFIDPAKEHEIIAKFSEIDLSIEERFRIYKALETYAKQKKIPEEWIQKFPFVEESELPDNPNDPSICKALKHFNLNRVSPEARYVAYENLKASRHKEIPDDGLLYHQEPKYLQPKTDWAYLNNYAIANYEIQLDPADNYLNIRYKILKEIKKYLTPDSFFASWYKLENWRRNPWWIKENNQQATRLFQLIKNCEDNENSLNQIQNILNCLRDKIDKQQLKNPEQTRYKTTDPFYQVLLASSDLIKNYLEYKQGAGSKIVLKSMSKSA